MYLYLIAYGISPQQTWGLIRPLRKDSSTFGIFCGPESTVTVWYIHYRLPCICSEYTWHSTIERRPSLIIDSILQNQARESS